MMMMMMRLIVARSSTAVISFFFFLSSISFTFPFFFGRPSDLNLQPATCDLQADGRASTRQPKHIAGQPGGQDGAAGSTAGILAPAICHLPFEKLAGTAGKINRLVA